MNHSYRPNCQAVFSHAEQSVTIEAIKPIKKGDEVVIDYGLEYFDAYIALIGCAVQSVIQRISNHGSVLETWK